MKLKPQILVAILIAASTALWAQERPERPPGDRPPRERAGGDRPGGERGPGDAQRPMRPPRFDPMMENFFPPELVMRHKDDLDLKEDQQIKLKEEMDKLMPQFQEIQQKIQPEMEKLHDLIKAEHVNEQAALAQSDKITVLENEIKRLRLGSLIKIKNLLTPDQQAKLQEAKKEMMRGREGEFRRGEGRREGDRPRPPGDGERGGNREGSRRPTPPPSE